MKKNNITNKIENKMIQKADTFVLEENITIQQAERLKKTLLSAIKEMNSIYIVGDNIKEIDLTFIQLMYSLKKSVKNQNKQIKYKITLPEDLSNLLDNNGFKSFNENLN